MMKPTLPAALFAAFLAFQPLAGIAAEPHDGAHDFDFNFGTWHTHIKRLTKPLTGSADFVELDGTVTVRKVWDGRAQLEEIEVDGPNGHMQGTTLFLYNPEAHQWSQIYASSKTGTLEPPMIGEFKNGKGELYGPDTLGSRTILTRGIWSDIKPDSHHFEIDFSDDGGKTWETVFSAALTRVTVD